MLLRAIVISNHRKEGFTNVSPSFEAGRPGASTQQRGTVIPIRVIDSKWPPPMSEVYLERSSPGVWNLASAISVRRELMHDDFISAVDPAAVTGGAFGDTNWRATNLVSYAYGQLGGVGTDAQGAGILVNANPTAQNISKDIAAFSISSDPAVWFSARLSTSTVANNLFNIGFGGPDARINYTGTGASDAVAAFQWDARGATATLYTINGTNGQTLSVPFVPQASVFFDIDIVVVGNASASDNGGFCSMWVNGDGPYTTFPGFIPDVTNAFSPFFGVLSLDGIDKDLRVDWVHVETFSPFIPPFLSFR